MVEYPLWETRENELVIVSGSTELQVVKAGGISRTIYDECEFAVRYQEGQSVLYEMLREDRYPRQFHYDTVFEQR